MLKGIWPFNLYARIAELEKKLHSSRIKHRKTKRDLIRRLKKERDEKKRLKKKLEGIEDSFSFIAHEIFQPIHITAAFINSIVNGVFGKNRASIIETLKSLYPQLKYAEETMQAIRAGASGNIVGKKTYDLRTDVIDFVVYELFDGEIKGNGIYIDNTLGSVPVGEILLRGEICQCLRIVFKNLVSNAIKYGGKGCTIAIGYRMEESCYVFNVYNSGPPISEDFQGKLFEKGERENPHIAEGNGYGLYHTKGLVENFGGSIRCETTPSGHPNFLVYLPIDIFEK